MGKAESSSDPPQQNQQEEDSPRNCDGSRVCNRSTLKWIIVVIVSINVLLVGLSSFPFLQKGSGRGVSGSLPNSTLQVQASFALTSPESVIKKHILKLEWEIWDEIGTRDTKVKILSVNKLTKSNGTQVTFGTVSSQDMPAISSVSLSLMREVFIVLVLRQYNLSLNSSDIFGKASSFQVVRFPGGFTVLPEQNHYPLGHIQVLFNFTLHYSIEQILNKLDQLEHQLHAGLSVKSNENLFVQLTNSKGSTLEPLVVVETSIVPVVGGDLAAGRLKQLAQEITRKHADNLGLNHTLFGNVKEIMLSSYLNDSALSPSPLPSPAPSPSQTILSPTQAPLPTVPAQPQVAPAPDYHGLAPSHLPSCCHHHHHHQHHHHPHHQHRRQHPRHSYRCKDRHSSVGPIAGHMAPSPTPSMSFVPQSSPPLNYRHPSVSPAPTDLPPRTSRKVFSCYKSFSPSSLVTSSLKYLAPIHDESIYGSPSISNLPYFSPTADPSATMATKLAASWNSQLPLTSSSLYSATPCSLFTFFLLLAASLVLCVTRS